MKRFLLATLLSLILLYAHLFPLLIASTAITGVTASPGAYMRVDPPTATISAPGQTVTVNVTVVNVTNYYGGDFWLHYNSTLIDCTNVDLWCDTVNPPAGPQIWTSITYGTGVVKVATAFTYAEGAVEFNGTGTMACLTFEGIAEGVSNLTFDLVFTSMIEIDYSQDPPTLGLMEMDPPQDGEIEVIGVAPVGDYHDDHLNDPTDAFPNDYAPMVIPVNGKSVTIAPIIMCTTHEGDVFMPYHYPCKSTQTLFVDDDWSDKDANYTYLFEDWIDYDWNDIMVSLYTVTSDIAEVEIRLEDREAAWKNPFSVEITPEGLTVDVHWNSTDYPGDHIVRVNPNETVDIELFAESNPGDTAFMIMVTPRTYTLTITSTSGGTTDPVPDSYSYNEGTVVLVTAFPDAGYVFDHWELDNINVGSVTSTSVTMDKDHTLHAVFKEAPAPPPPVGGHAIPIDKSRLLAPKSGLTPRIGLASVLLAAMALTIILIRRRNKTLK